MDKHPFLNPEFLTSWSRLTPEKVKPDIQEAIARAKKNIEQIHTQRPEQYTYETTFGALEKATEELHLGWTRLMHLDSVMDNQAQREAITEMMPEVVIFSSSISLNPELWNALKAASECPWVKELSPVKQRFIEETLKDFRESGADLPGEQKERYAQIESELNMLTKEFSENVLDSTNAWELVVTDPAMMAGIPEMAKEAARLDALDKGHGTEEAPAWRITLQQPSMTPVMQFADSDDLRRKVWEGSNGIGRGDKDNAALIASILKLREEKAKMLGFDSFGDYATSRRMAKSGQNALDFINRLHSEVYKPYQKEMEILLDYKNKKTGRDSDMLSPWETSYWSEKQRKELFDFDSENLRPYYSVANVMQGIFSIFGHLYGINFTQLPTVFLENGRKRTADEQDAVEVWHPEVLFYEVHDCSTGEHLGSFYADWHPRESKRGGAWMNCLVTGMPPQNKTPGKPHLGLVIGNMTKPVGSKPALLSHDEVETIFHEFGHLLHQILSDVKVKSLAGTNVAWDFVELPSQINENWCWERESVNLYAMHYETGEKIPQELFSRMRKARNYMSATAFMRQLAFGKLDLELHVNYPKYANGDLEEIDREILKNYRVRMTDESPSVARRMTHLFAASTGYAAGYYSYKWAEVLEADAFSRFLKEGIMNDKTGHDFRRSILSKGNSKPAEELFRDFMGREPDTKALLVKSGIIQ